MTSKGAQYTLIANVPYDTVRQDLVSEFRRFGRVELAMVVCDEASRHPHKEWTSTAGYAFVRFSKKDEASAAIQAASMGLVTIRGVRVRADWARKDSYAKRGRVSHQQGAPLMGSEGVPDGIQALRSSLLSRGLPPETTPVWVASHLQQKQQQQSTTWSASSYSPTGSPRRKNSYPTTPSISSGGGGGCEEDLYGGLSDPTTSAGTTDLSFSPMSFTSTSVKLPSLDSASNQHRYLTTTTTTSISHENNANAAAPSLPQYDRLYANLAEILSGKHIDANACSSTTGSLTPKSPRPLSPPLDSVAGEFVSGSETTQGDCLPPKLPGFDNVLSPCSRGLLEQALSDVAFTSCCDGSPAGELTRISEAVSYSSSSRREQQPQPEELLHAAIKCCDLAGIHL